MDRSIGKFEIIRRLGKGAMGEVFLARDPKIGREVAIKTILPTLMPLDDVRQRFAREAQAAGVLQHPNVATVFEYGEDHDVLFLVMEYVPGEDLGAMLQEETLRTPEVLEIVAAVAASRVGSVIRTRSKSDEEMEQGGGDVGMTVAVAPQFKFVGYGGGANMLDYGATKRFASYVHHINEQDGITYFFGMADPFQQSPFIQGANAVLIALQSASGANPMAPLTLPRKLAMRAGFGALITEAIFTPTSGHQARIATGPTRMEVDAWRNFHRVIWHRKEGSLIQTLNLNP